MRHCAADSAGAGRGRQVGSKPRRKRLVEIATTNPDETRRLRAMWALHVTGGVPAELIAQAARRTRTNTCAAGTIQLALDREQADLAELLPQFAAMAESDPSPVVRLYLASALQRLPLDDRWDDSRRA